MRATRHLTLVMLAITLAGCGLNETERRPAPQGIRLRVTAAVCRAGNESCETGVDRRFEAQLIVVDPEVLVVYDVSRKVRKTLPIRSVSRLEIFRGYDPSLEAALRNGARDAAIGMVAGAALGLVAGGIFDVFGFHVDKGEAVRAGAAQGAVSGLVHGVAQGATIGDAVWEQISVRQLRDELCHCRAGETVAATESATTQRRH